MKGMKQTKAKPTKERLKELETANQNSQMALQMSQMMLKHLTNQVSALQKDLSATMGMVNDFQYRTLAMLELGSFDVDAVNAKGAELKLKDFNAASDKEDVEKGFEIDPAGVVLETSIITLTSTTPDIPEDFGIFRSKFHMKDCNTPGLREKLLGAKVGDFIEVELQGNVHKIEILGVRLQKVVEEAAADVATGAVAPAAGENTKEG